MELIPVLIGGLIAMIVGVELIPSISTTVSTLDTNTTQASVISLAQLLPLIFVASLIIAAVALFFNTTGNQG